MVGPVAVGVALVGAVIRVQDRLRHFRRLLGGDADPQPTGHSDRQRGRARCRTRHEHATVTQIDGESVRFGSRRVGGVSRWYISVPVQRLPHDALDVAHAILLEVRPMIPRPLPTAHPVTVWSRALSPNYARFRRALPLPITRRPRGGLGRTPGGPPCRAASRGRQRNRVCWMVQGQFASRIAPAPRTATTRGGREAVVARGRVGGPGGGWRACPGAPGTATTGAG